ncbi:HAD domain-containing protein [Ramlibacter alkalitolerans]|uniref:FCP1 homology domain-containing protein n=1 Tax=Ramlibacter alkalitolerans TaxID=2039631 RepID=A0ABS1JMF1_9BURK|nr:HAD domain-containing protein [Ramlibacter alkalitolerans]MBL0425413.1 hypothetical protein [Ramlibacter alkalitolerans]
MRVLFLDFDGVLSRAGTEDEQVQYFVWLPLLAQLLAPWPDVFVAVHSTWRYTHTPAELRDLLGPLGERFIGCVPRGQRAESIRWFVHANPRIHSYLVLDDAPGEFPSDMGERLVVCQPHVDVSDPEVQARISAWLATPQPSVAAK